VTCLKCGKVMHGGITSPEKPNGIKCPKNCPIGDDDDDEKASPVLMLHTLAVAAAYTYRTTVASGSLYDFEQGTSCTQTPHTHTHTHTFTHTRAQESTCHCCHRCNT